MKYDLKNVPTLASIICVSRKLDPKDFLPLVYQNDKKRWDRGWCLGGLSENESMDQSLKIGVK